MKRKSYAIITAAGSGRRFSSNNLSGLKQFILLKRKPVIAYSLLAFQKCKSIDEIVITANRKHFEFIHSLLTKFGITKITNLVEGGYTRFESVRNGFSVINGNPDDIVFIHDAARPNISANFIEYLSGNFKKCDALIPGIIISETVKKASKGFVQKTIKRDGLWVIQTPQLFKYSSLKKSYRKTKKNDFTDEASLLEYAGYKVKLVDGKRDNIKITTEEDLYLLKKLM